MKQRREGKRIAPKVINLPSQIRMLPAEGVPSAALLLPFLTEAAARAKVGGLAGKRGR